MPAFFDLDRADEQETETRQPTDAWTVPVIEGKSDGRGWTWSAPLVALVKTLRSVLRR